MLGGCAVGPDFVRPAPPDTDRYTREPRPEAAVAADGQAQHFTPGAAVTADWRRLFRSAQLDAVVRKAVANNPTLQASETSLRQSQDNMRADYGVFFPQIQAGLDGSRQRTAGEALNLLQANYHAGLVAYLDVLTADVQFHRATIAYLQAVEQRHQDTVALFVALGGSWWSGQRPTGEGEAP
jgi:outer membrane protein TolC